MRSLRDPPLRDRRRVSKHIFKNRRWAASQARRGGAALAQELNNEKTNETAAIPVLIDHVGEAAQRSISAWDAPDATDKNAIEAGSGYFAALRNRTHPDIERRHPVNAIIEGKRRIHHYKGLLCDNRHFALLQLGQMGGFEIHLYGG
ncbi:MAG: hypothetical protein LBU32_31935 [Clostridiales bacterium]|nr:hypothetical protein [Clostridiales bacterium]